MTYYIRLDDASENMNLDAWLNIEKLLDTWGIKPLFGIIPNNHDPNLIEKYESNPDFWNLVDTWIKKGWTPALHGYNHCYCSNCSGINPVNPRSEFAGVALDLQKSKIREGIKILRLHAIEPKIFFAPSHTYDLNTLTALKEESNIRIISDTMANDVYTKYGFHFIPIQSGRPRKLPFKRTTICLHPNTMTGKDFEALNAFLEKYHTKFGTFSEIKLNNKPASLLDKLMQKIYYFIRTRRFK